MARQLSPNTDGEYEWTEVVTDEDIDDLEHQDPVVQLHQVDGVDQTGADREPSWLRWEVEELGEVDGVWKEKVHAFAETKAIEDGKTYTFKYEATDGTDATALLRNFTVPIFGAARLWVLGSSSSNPDRVSTYDPDNGDQIAQNFFERDQIENIYAPFGQNVYVVYQDDTDDIFTIRKYDIDRNVIWDNKFGDGNYSLSAKKMGGGPDGNLWFGTSYNSNAHIIVFDPTDGSIVKEQNVSIGNSEVDDISFDNYGYFYIPHSTADPSVAKYDTDFNQVATGGTANCQRTLGLHDLGGCAYAYNDGIYRLSPDLSTREWAAPTTANFVDLAYVPDAGYVLGIREASGYVEAVDVSDGSQVWVNQDGVGGRWVVRDKQERVFFEGPTGEVDVADGSLVWQNAGEAGEEVALLET